MPAARNPLLDYAKGVGILLVVYGHVARGVFNAGLPMDRALYSLVDSVIYSFHMPLFFFLSGILFLASLEKRGYLGMMRGKLSTVLYPYVLWSLIQGGIEFGLSSYTNGTVTLGEVFALLWRPRAQFWFLYVLFGIFLFAGLLYRKPTPPWTGAVLVLALVLYLTGYSPADIYLLNALPHWFVYFALGVSGAFLLDWIASPRYLLLAVAAAVFGLGQWGVHTLPALSSASYAPALDLALAVLGIVFVLALSQRFAAWNWGWLAHIGRHSMEIYLIHILASSGARIGLQKLLGVTDAGAHLLVGTLFGVAVPLLLVVYARRWRLGWLFTPPEGLRVAK